ncbi:hypothetical protein RGQ29_013420 [Quercus rubra]|uniref:Uncharacterized protein n=1 Tax=Quercus rubra TaxID=3512 RepID=A0AAN7G9K1_QUERU|nr:hypothetical protein RGQ29_013420 [Quercus rubra]
MNGYAKIKIINTHNPKSRSVDFSADNVSSFLQTPKKPTKNTDSDHTSKAQEESNQIKATNTKYTKTTQESLQDEEYGNGGSFGMVLKKSLSVSSTTAGFQSAVKRAFSMTRSSSVSERYGRIHDQSVALVSPIDDYEYDDDEEVGDNSKGTRRSGKKKYKGGKILKVCKRLFGL